MDKPKFSLFLDFDGALSDILTIPKFYKFGGLLVSKNDDNVFNPESIEALNMLIKTIESRYSIELVLATFWRHNADKCKEILKNNGLNFNGETTAVPFLFAKSKFKEIKKYIDSNNIDNYLVIDDHINLEKHFEVSKTIKTNIINGSLTNSVVLNYIDKYMPELSSEVKISEVNFI